MPADKKDFKDRTTMITATTVNMFVSLSGDMEVHKKIQNVYKIQIF